MRSRVLRNSISVILAVMLVFTVAYTSQNAKAAKKVTVYRPTKIISHSTDSNGKPLTTVTKYSYNKNGLLMKGLSDSEKTEFQRNSKGLVKNIKVYRYNKLSEMYNSTIKKGKVTKQKYYLFNEEDGKKEYQSVRNMKYHGNGNLAKIVSTLKDGSVGYTAFFRKNGIRSKTVGNTWKYVYDKNGDYKYCSSKGKGKSSENRKYSYKYNKRGDVVYTKETSISKDEKGKISKYVWIQKTSIKYDKHGNMIKKVYKAKYSNSKSYKYSAEYKYKSYKIDKRLVNEVNGKKNIRYMGEITSI